MQLRQRMLSLKSYQFLNAMVQYKVSKTNYQRSSVSRTVNLNYSGSLPVENTLHDDLTSARGILQMVLITTN